MVKTKEEINALRKEFENYMNKHRVIDDYTKKERLPYTHTYFGPVPYTGKFNINDEEYDTFLNMYKNLAFKTDKLFIVERQKMVGPLCIDIDYKTNEEKRQYTYDHIEKLCSIIFKRIKKYFSLDNKEIELFVQEKASPSYKESDEVYKDGFHIVCPLGFDVISRFFLFDRIKKESEREDIFGDIEITEDCNYNNIFDDSVINRNGWMMYGSVKNNGKIYVVRKIYKSDEDNNIIECNLDNYTTDELVVKLSMRTFIDEDKLDFNELYQEEQKKDKVIAIFENYQPGKKKRKVLDDKDSEKLQNMLLSEKPDREKLGFRNGMPVDKSGQIEYAKKLVELLSVERATDYHKWISVGWALHNVDNKELFDTFVEFSKKTKKKFDENACIEVWNRARNEGLNIPSLQFWASMDNPEGYKQLLSIYVEGLLTEAATGTHQALANLVFNLYKDYFRCTSISKNIWYEFKKHKWQLIDCGYSLKEKITNDLPKIVYDLIQKIYGLLSITDKQDKDRYESKKKAYELLISKLGTVPYVNNVFEMCKNKFHSYTIESKFEEKLDENRDLLGFENGVYDLENDSFREGLPDDFITLSTGYNYVDFKGNEPIFKDIDEFFRKVHTEQDMRDYVLHFCASCLNGHIEAQKFIIWTGGGANGKSTVTDLIKYTFGKYYSPLPTEVLTRKKKDGAGPDPHLADKKGKRLLFIQEPEHTDTIQVGLMKSLTGGDVLATRALFSNPIEFNPQFKLVLTTNQLPSIPASDGGTWRRIRVTPWESRFCENPQEPREFMIDPSLNKKLKSWREAFMWLLLKKYYISYKNNGNIIAEPEKVKLHTNEYEKGCDNIAEFISEKYERTKDKNDKISLEDIYGYYKQWFSVAHGSKCVSRKEFKEYLKMKKYVLTANHNIMFIRQKIDETDSDSDDDDDDKNIKLKNSKKSKSA